MSIKLLLLRSGEEIITEVREMVDPDTKEPMGYHLHKPFVLEIVSSEDSGIVLNREKGYQLHWFPWAPLSKDRDFFLPSGHVLTAYDPLDAIAHQYADAIQEEVYEKNFKEHEAMIAGQVGDLDMEAMFEEAEKLLEDDNGNNASDP